MTDLISLSKEGDIDSLISLLTEMKSKYGNLPIYYDDDSIHETVKYIEYYPGTSSNESMCNGGLPPRLVVC